MRSILLTIVLVVPVVAGTPSSELCSGEARSYLLEVSAEDAEPGVSFKGAVGHDTQLQLIEATTPHRLELRASRIVAVFAPAAGTLRATLYGLNANGSREKLGHTAGNATLILENINCPEVPRTFGSF